MNLKEFKRNSISKRLEIVEKESNPSYVVELLADHLNQKPEQLLKVVDINARFVPKTVELIRKPEHGFEEFTKIFYYLQSRGLEFDSISQDSIRFNLVEFFNKIV